MGSDIVTWENNSVTQILQILNGTFTYIYMGLYGFDGFLQPV